MYCFLQSFLFYPSTCVVFTSYTACSSRLFVSAAFFCFFCFDVLTLPHSHYRGTQALTALLESDSSTHSESRGLPGRPSQTETRRDSCVAETEKLQWSYCRFPSLHTCIIQLNIFPFYSSKYSWVISAQGKLFQNLANMWKVASCLFFFFFFFFGGRSCFFHRTLCYVTPSPANDIMNSQHDTKEDEGIFEHSKEKERVREKGRERERTFPKLIFISRVHAYLIESAWIS